MSRLQLNATAFIRLQAQVRLNGTFHHRLLAENPRRSVFITVAIEQCGQAVHVEAIHNGTRNSITLDRERRDNAARMARFIEATVNGDAASGTPETDECLLVSELELILRQAIRHGHGTYRLPAHELEPELVISRNLHGSHVVQLHLDGARTAFTLPADRAHAYPQLVDHLRRFLQDYRNAFSAVA